MKDNIGTGPLDHLFQFLKAGPVATPTIWCVMIGILCACVILACTYGSLEPFRLEYRTKKKNEDAWTAMVCGIVLNSTFVLIAWWFMSRSCPNVHLWYIALSGFSYGVVLFKTWIESPICVPGSGFTLSGEPLPQGKNVIFFPRNCP